MANIVISRIQHRRGRRENLPQPLLPAEIALTSDTNQTWIGQDPALAVAGVNVYNDKSQPTAQTIIDNNLVESRFDADFNAGIFATMVTELTGNATVTLTADDILWDSTFRGEILTVTGSGGSGYTGGGAGVGDPVTAISSTGSGFVGWVDTVDGGNAILTIVVTSGGTNYQYTNTTFTVANGTGGTASVAIEDILGTVVHIAADPNVDADNTVANIVIEVAALSTIITDRLISSAAYDGTFLSNVMLVDNHVEAANVVALINRVNSTTPFETTGIVHTNLNLELTTNQNDITSFQLAASDLATALAAGVNNAYFRMPRSMTVTEVRGSLLTASTSGAVTVDINKNGVSILSTDLTIDQDEKTSLTAATPAVISDVTLVNDDEITIDIDGEGTGAIGLIVTIIGLA